MKPHKSRHRTEDSNPIPSMLFTGLYILFINKKNKPSSSK